MRNVNRRTFVLGGLGGLALGATGAAISQRIARSNDATVQALTRYPFRLGIASGEPHADSVVLWTRLAPSPLDADGHGGMGTGPVVVEWQVSTNALYDDDAHSVFRAVARVTEHGEDGYTARSFAIEAGNPGLQPL